MSDDEILVVAGPVGQGGCPYDWYDDDVIRFARAIIAKEREECAKVCDTEADDWGCGDCRDTAERCAAAIRARGDKP